MRVFFALELSDEMKEYIYKKSKLIKKHAKKGRFTDQDNYHLTLKFIGNVEVDELTDLTAAMTSAASKIPSFTINLSTMDYFQKGRSKILYFDVQNNFDQLNVLFQTLEKALAKKGYGKDQRAFTPHITIGRKVRLTKSIDELNQLLALDDRAIPVEKISLMESTRINDRLRYIPLTTVQLQSKE
jgi:2'-5' RNA ligase